MRERFLTATLSLLAGVSFGQEVTVPSLMVRGDAFGERVPLRISEYHADVLIAGASASTTLTLVFENERNRQLEGRLILPIGEGKTVSRFAMDVNGKIREGVVVERNKARRVFEAIVARRVDPGLLSWVDGSRYEARVFPIPKLGTKTIVVRYEELLPFRWGSNVSYSLPVDLGVKFDHFTARVRFAQPDTDVQSRRRDDEALVFPTRGEKRGIAEIDKRDYEPQRPLRVDFSIDSDCVVTAPREGGGRYFFSRPSLPTGGGRREAPKRVALFWDNSGSARERNRERELALLDAYLGALGDAEVRLSVFAFEAEEPETFAVKEGKWDALRERLAALQPDGATNFDALDWTWADADEILLFSDGAGTIGPGELGALPVPVYPVMTNRVSTGDSLMERIAARSGGRVVRVGDSLEGALAQVRSTPGRLFRTVGEGKLEFSQLFPDGAGFDSRPLVAGVVEGEGEGAVVLSHGQRSSDPATRRLEIPEPVSGVPDPALASLVYQMWVRAKLEALEPRRRTHWREIAALSAEAGLVTPDSSLLVLDLLSDYVNNRIPPPPSEPELLAQYNDRVQAPRPPRPDEQFAAVRSRFDEWYGKRFPWLEESSLRLAKNGVGYLKGLVRRNPDREDFSEDLRRMKPMLDRAEGLKKERFQAVDEGERAAWLAKALALQKELEPLRQKYGSAYLKQMAAVRKVWVKYDFQRMTEGRGLFSGDVFDGDPFGGGEARRPAWADAFFLSDAAGGDDPFSSGGADPPRESQLSLRTGGPMTPVTVRRDARSRAESPELALLKATEGEQEFVERYFERRVLMPENPLLYVDAGDLAADRGFDALAVRVLSNLAELKIDDVRLLRMLAYRLDTHRQHEIALGIYRHIHRLVPEDHVAMRDLALALARCGKAQEAFDLLWAIVTAPEGSTLNAIVLTDLKQLLADNEVDTIVLPEGAEGLRKDMALDLRVVATWDTDAIEIDFFVVEPGNGLAGPGKKGTLTGGQLDGVTEGGFGPEQYLIKRALPGEYQLRASVHPGRRRGSLPAPSTIYLDVTKHFGTEKAERQRFAIRVGPGETKLETVIFSAEDVKE